MEKLGTIPQVREKQELILKVAETDYIKQADFWSIEKVRQELRNLIQFIDPYMRPPVYIDIEDTLNDIDEEYVYVSTGNNFSNYRKKLEKFLTGNMENVIIWKIRHNIRLTEQDKENLEKILFEELGNNKEYAEAFGDTNIIKAVRNIVGLDKSVVSDIFYKYINDNRLNMKQIQFVKLLIDYVIKNGTIDMQKLTEQPFKNVGEVYDLFGNNIDLFKEIREDINSLHEIIKAKAYINKLEDIKRIIRILSDKLQSGVKAETINIILNEINSTYCTSFECKNDEDFCITLKNVERYLIGIIENKINEKIIKNILKK